MTLTIEILLQTGVRGQSWSWSYGSWIYNYLCNQFLSPITLWVWIPLIVRCIQCNII